MKWVLTIALLIIMIAAVVGVIFLHNGTVGGMPVLSQSEETTVEETTETTTADPEKTTVAEVDLDDDTETTTAKSGKTTTEKDSKNGSVEKIVSTSPGAEEV